MVMILLNLFVILIEVFFWNRIIVSIVSFISSIKRKKMWAIILVSVLDALLLWLYGIDTLINYNTYVSQGEQPLYVILNGVLSSAVVIFMYLQTIYAINPGLKFKSARQRRFERDVKGKEVSYAVPLVITGVLGAGGVFSWIYYSINYTSSYETELLTSKIVSIVCITLFVYFIVMTIIKAKMPKPQDDCNVITIKAEVSKEYQIIFVLDVEGNVELYKTTVKGNINMKDLLGNIADYYYISSYGILRKDGCEYKLYGIKTTSFDIDLYPEIKMERFIDKDIERIVPSLDKNHSKIFNFDETIN